SGTRRLMGWCVLAFSPFSTEEIFPFIKITHNSRYSVKYTWFFIEFIRCLLEYVDKGQALQQAQQRCGV
ncbi:ADP-ribosylglycohydrolase, partial [Phocaeicola vulgatus]|nr:ADP-ribosylglycohydrolase [Phocaeicola vulgatus]